MFVVEIVELTLASIDEATAQELNESDDLRSLVERLSRGDNVVLLERLSISVMDGQQVTVQTGKSVSVPQGTESRGGFNQRPRSYSRERIGTMAIIALRELEADGELLLELQYEVSRLADALEADVTPRTTTKRIETTLRLPLGKSTIVQSGAADNASLLVVTVDSQHRIYAHAPREVIRAAAVSVPLQLPSSIGDAGQEPGGEETQQQTVTRIRPLVGTGGIAAEGDGRERFAAMIFDRADEDRDGLIRSDEAQGIPILFRRFTDLDRDGNQILSREEVIQGVDTLLSRPEE